MSMAFYLAHFSRDNETLSRLIKTNNTLTDDYEVVAYKMGERVICDHELTEDDEKLLNSKYLADFSDLVIIIPENDFGIPINEHNVTILTSILNNQEEFGDYHANYYATDIGGLYLRLSKDDKIIDISKDHIIFSYDAETAHFVDELIKSFLFDDKGLKTYLAERSNNTLLLKGNLKKINNLDEKTKLINNDKAVGKHKRMAQLARPESDNTYLQGNEVKTYSPEGPITFRPDNKKTLKKRGED